MCDPYGILSANAATSLKAADAALKILDEKISQLRRPLVIGNENKLFNNQFKNLTKLELMEMDHIRSSISGITEIKKKIMEAELVCLTANELMATAISKAMVSCSAFESRINETHDKLKVSDLGFLADASSTQADEMEKDKQSAECSYPTSSAHVELDTRVVGHSAILDQSLSTMGITNPVFKYNLKPPVYTSTFAKEVMERKEIEKRLQQPSSVKKGWPLTFSGLEKLHPTPMLPQSDVLSVIASGGSSLTGSPYLADQKQNNNQQDPYTLIPYRDRLLEQSTLPQPQFDESDSALFDFDNTNLEVAFIEESSSLDMMKENGETSRDRFKEPVASLQPADKAMTSIRTPLVQKSTDDSSGHVRPSLAFKGYDDSTRQVRPSLAGFDLKRPVYTSSFGKQFNK